MLHQYLWLAIYYLQNPSYKSGLGSWTNSKIHEALNHHLIQPALPLILCNASPSTTIQQAKARLFGRWQPGHQVTITVSHPDYVNLSRLYRGWLENLIDRPKHLTKSFTMSPAPSSTLKWGIAHYDHDPHLTPHAGQIFSYDLLWPAIRVFFISSSFPQSLQYLPLHRYRA